MELRGSNPDPGGEGDDPSKSYASKLKRVGDDFQDRDCRQGQSQVSAGFGSQIHNYPHMYVKPIVIVY